MNEFLSFPHMQCAGACKGSFDVTDTPQYAENALIDAKRPMSGFVKARLC